MVHRRGGKSTGLMWRGLRKALTWSRPHLPESKRALKADPPRVIHVLPERVQWERTGLWDRLERAAKSIPGAEPMVSKLLVKLPNGGVYQAGGMDKPDSWRGGYADEVIEDEADDVTAAGLDMVVEPMLSDYLGTRLYAGTPKGNGRLQQRYDDAGHMPGAERFLLPYTATGALSEEAISRLRARLTEEEFAQEMECSFTAPNAGSYYSRLLDQAEAQGRVTQVPYDPRFPVETWWDLGMDDAMAIWFVQVMRSGGAVRVIDYMEDSGEMLGHYASALKAKGYAYGQHRLPHDIEVRELGAGSRKGTLLSLGVKPILTGVKCDPVERINAVKMLLPRCVFDAEKTALGRKALRHFRRKWNEDRGVWEARPVHDWSSHAADAFGEGAVNFRDRSDEQPRLPRTTPAWDPYAHQGAY